MRKLRFSKIEWPKPGEKVGGGYLLSFPAITHGLAYIGLALTGLLPAIKPGLASPMQFTKFHP